MKFSDMVKQAVLLLHESQRLTYRALKLEFDLTDEQLDVLKEELIEARELAVDKDGKMLVWVGGGEQPTAQQPATRATLPSRQAKPTKRASTNPKKAPGTRRRTTKQRPPASYTPPHLAERIRAEQAAMEARGATGGERKLVTHLFSDLKGSTALIEGLDPEDARAIVDPALQLMMDAVHRYEGYVAQVPGDGIFALFGAPIAHEDHPQRALYAALLMQEQMRRYSDTLREQGHPPLLMRIGVNTGEVVVRSIHKEDLHTDYIPVGRSTNIAARMEQLAAPGTILVSEQTHKLTAGYFEFKPLGKTQVKGIEQPLQVYEVIGAGPLRTRLQVAARRGLTRFVGRHTEMDQIRRALDQARTGHGQIVGVMGEPGVGKSRLFYEFKLTSLSGCLVLEAFSVSYGKASPYLPIIELLKTYFEITLEDDERKRREKVIGKVLGLDRSLEDTLPYLFSLLGIEEQTASLQQMDAQIRRRRTFDALKRLLLRESLNQPLILIFEDLHWIDTETQGFLDVLSEGVASARILLLVNYRPEYRHEWGSKTYYTQLRLAPLGKDEAEELLTFLLGTDPGLKALKQLILDKTEGTPFFIEEVVQTLAEEGILTGEHGHYRLMHHAPTQHALTLHISPTVQGVLMARIDRLAPAEKAFLHQLAVIGRQFPLSLVRRVVPQPEEELYRLLALLQSKEFLYEQPAFPEPDYLFKHALTQEVAYGTVLQDRRRALHERTAQAMETLYHDRLAEHYSELAHHYTCSGNREKAIEYLQLAGQQAVRRSANSEAIGHFTTALELLQTLPDTPERARQELTLHLALGSPLQATKGWSAPEVERVYNRARELCQQGGEPAQLMPTLWGLAAFYLIRGELKTADEIAEQCLSIARSVEDPTFSLVAHHAKEVALFGIGELLAARAHCEQGMALYDPQWHGSLVSLYTDDPGTGCQGMLALILCALGYPDQGLQQSRTALTLARQAAHPFSLNTALLFAAQVCHYRREWQALTEQTEAALAIAEEQGFAFREAWNRVWRGRALAEQGQIEEGIAQIHQGLADLRATGTEWGRPHFLALLAEAYGKADQAEAGLSVLAEALDIVSKTGECFYEAELHRLKGTLTLQSQTSLERVSDKSKANQDKSEDTNPQSPTPDPQAEAEACFHKAIEIARQQHAKSWELRAATSLARLWQQQGKKTEAHDLLAPVYTWFTEGFDTKDLQDAKALLGELGERL
jgi:class 3 adenylate cyclase/predicted ATPase